ncbi:PC-esterase domain-containing protein 1A-like [Onthophagus taurus]|uniref:PC-esterase domain-containing protein 1A-like n=1 Tax=Onthophagus taurus TaxID=166361 RepID=UPI0039BE1CD1
MSVELFAKDDAINLFKSQRILMFGDSNMRALYKDLIWLTRYGTLIPNEKLRAKNEDSFSGDKRLSEGVLTASRNYVEIREYKREFHLHYEFITRIYTKKFEDFIESLKVPPNFIIMNSCVWDLSRWGPNGIQDYKANVDKTLHLLRNKFPKTCIVFTTTLPISLKARGGFLTENVQFLNAVLPFSIVEANNYVAKCCRKYDIDLIDLHYYMQYQIDSLVMDGIHWDPAAIRFINNIIFTNLCQKVGKQLPNNIAIHRKCNTKENERKEIAKNEIKPKIEQNYYNRYDFTTCN